MKSTRRDAFTLAEMLVVIAIILILAALLVPAAFMALGVARNGAIAVELGQLDNAMKQYKVLYKSYPPNFDADGDIATAPTTAENDLVKAHIRAAFGRSNPAPPVGLDAGEALVYWLQGYSNNPIDPLGGTRVALMQFDQTRLKLTRTVSGVALYHYFPANGQSQPYVYIHNARYSTLSYAATSPGVGRAVAYKSELTGNPYVNLESYQIISAGQDGDYGPNTVATPPIFPTAPGGNKDNITNFSGGTLTSKVQ